MITDFLNGNVMMCLAALASVVAGGSLAATAHLGRVRRPSLEPIGGALFVAGLILLGTTVPFI